MKVNPRGTLALLIIMTVALVTLGSGRQSARNGNGKLKQVEGDVEVNGTPAISGATVFSDSTITTAARSSAVVSLGKLGRVEVLPESEMKLSFDDEGLTVAMLDAGRVRLSSSANVNAITRDAEITGLSRGRNDFTVDTSCGNTFVAVRTGRVELRAGNSVKQIAAGGQDTAGTALPGCVPGQ